MLNLGCGNHRAPAPWVNVDQYAGSEVEADVVAQASNLPFKSHSISALYCGHLLEHLEYESELPAVLAEIRRVLTVNGRLCVVGPDYDRAEANPEWHVLLSVIRDGADRWPGDRHQWLSTGPATVEAMREVFPGAREVDITTLSDWPLVDDVGWQFAVLAR